MTRLKQIFGALLLAALVCASPRAASQPPAGEQPKPVEQFGEYVPLEDLPPTEQIPAARLVIIAYAFVWGAVLFYVVTVARRLGSVQREVERLEIDMKQGKRP